MSLLSFIRIGAAFCCLVMICTMVAVLSGVLANSRDSVNACVAYRITSIAAGLNHNAAMSVAGEIYMWGSNKHGCLGLGDTSDRALPTKVLSLLMPQQPEV